MSHDSETGHPGLRDLPDPQQLPALSCYSRSNQFMGMVELEDSDLCTALREGDPGVGSLRRCMPALHKTLHREPLGRPVELSFQRQKPLWTCSMSLVTHATRKQRGYWAFPLQSL